MPVDRGLRAKPSRLSGLAFLLRLAAVWLSEVPSTMLTDLKFAIRVLAHSRGFTVTALLVLTLGIAATTTMFSATNAVLLKRVEADL